MPSYLGDYKGAASNRDTKLIRAISSVVNQKFTNWELIVIADGCEKTFDIVCSNFESVENVECLLIDKQPLWSGNCRNFGIEQSTGERIIYLDADDYYGPNHLQIIDDNFGNNDWVWYNDLLKNKDGHHERKCSIKYKFQNGTSNICHNKSLGAKWPTVGYGNDDWGLVQNLKRLSSNFSQIETPEYVVCHIPKQIDL